jgi:hypothetical protein
MKKTLSDGVFAACLSGLVVLVTVSMCAPPAPAHGEYEWVMPLVNPATGEGCCGETDCHATMNYTRYGENYIIGMPDGRVRPFPAKDTRLSQDHHARAVVCLRPDGSVRCFFIPSGA